MIEKVNTLKLGERFFTRDVGASFKEFDSKYAALTLAHKLNEVIDHLNVNETIIGHLNRQ